ncbi:unnamed protein product [Calypogeia fissa]
MLITRMAAQGVPDDVGMLVSGHHTANGYSRYDKTRNLRMEATTMVAANPSWTYDSALAEVSDKFMSKVVVGTHSNLKPLTGKAIEENCNEMIICEIPKVQPLILRMNGQAKGGQLVKQIENVKITNDVHMSKAK